MAYMSAGTAVGLVRGRVFAERVLVAVLVVLCAAPAADLIRLVFAPPPSLGSWLTQVLIGAPYSAAAAAPMYLVVRAVMSRLLGDIEA